MARLDPFGLAAPLPALDVFKAALVEIQDRRMRDVDQGDRREQFLLRGIVEV